MKMPGFMSNGGRVPVSDAIVARSRSSFASAFHFLPRRKQDAIKTFYAFCRELDDGVDRAPDRAAALASVAFWRGEIDRIRDGGKLTPLGEEIDETVHGLDLSLENFELVIEGVEMDLVRTRYETFEDLYRYCFRVASSVGFVCCEILGATGGNVMRYAELTGIGVQLTNILRDVREDAAMGRIYLPLADMRTFGVAERDVLEDRKGEALLRLLRFEGARAEALFKLGQGGLSAADGARLYFCHLLSGSYMALLRELQASDFKAGKDKVTVSTGKKLGMGLRTAVSSIIGTLPL